MVPFPFFCLLFDPLLKYIVDHGSISSSTEHLGRVSGGSGVHLLLARWVARLRIETICGKIRAGSVLHSRQTTPLTFDFRQNGQLLPEARTTELLHTYIYDYCKKHNFGQAAKAFAQEAGVQVDQVPPIDIPSGFLGDWWSVFWDVYNAKHNETLASKDATTYQHVRNSSMKWLDGIK